MSHVLSSIFIGHRQNETSSNHFWGGPPLRRCLISTMSHVLSSIFMGHRRTETLSNKKREKKYSFDISFLLIQRCPMKIEERTWEIIEMRHRLNFANVCSIAEPVIIQLTLFTVRTAINIPSLGDPLKNLPSG